MTISLYRIIIKILVMRLSKVMDSITKGGAIGCGPGETDSRCYPYCKSGEEDYIVRNKPGLIFKVDFKSHLGLTCTAGCIIWTGECVCE